MCIISPFIPLQYNLSLYAILSPLPDIIFNLSQYPIIYLSARFSLCSKCTEQYNLFYHLNTFYSNLNLIFIINYILKNKFFFFVRTFRIFLTFYKIKLNIKDFKDYYIIIFLSKICSLKVGVFEFSLRHTYIYV